MYIIDSTELPNNKTRVLLIDNDKLEVRTYNSRNLPKSDDSHPRANNLKINRFGNKLSIGDFAECTITNDTAVYSKGDFRLRSLIDSYLGVNSKCKYKDF